MSIFKVIKDAKAEPDAMAAKKIRFLMVNQLV